MDFAIMCDRAAWIQRDERGRLHATDRQAICFRDGWGLWRWHGIAVPESVILRPQEITIAQIDKETNVEVRRVMIERFGATRYLLEGGAKKLHADGRGELWEKIRKNDSPIRMVKVVNSTPESDGSRHTFYLRVPPAIKTASEAVAWTFNRKAEEYNPVIET